MEKFTQTVQKYLMKMEQKHGKLKFLSSRATEETSRIIDEIIESVGVIFNWHNICLRDNSVTIDSRSRMYYIKPNVASSYMWLLLNTHFKSQSCFTEDIRYGHIVGQWPSLSPYLFMQIIWHFKYEMIMTLSLRYIPLDICIEILEIVVTCVHELELTRARALILELIVNIYERCLQLYKPQITQYNLKECTLQIVSHFQCLLNLLIDNKMTRFFEFSTEAKYHEHGILIKLLLRYIQKCLWIKKEGKDEDCIINNIFTFTYSAYYQTLPGDNVADIVTLLDRELFTLLCKQLQEITAYEYIHWAEVIDTEIVDTMISLQRAIAIECQEFVQCMNQDIFPSDSNLRECLLRYVGTSPLTLEELCYCVINGKSDRWKELIERYKEWDQSALNFIDRNVKLLTRDDGKILLQYLRHLIIQEERRFSRICTISKLVIKILMQLDIRMLFDIIMEYIIKYLHDDNPLVILYSQEKYLRFIANQGQVWHNGTARIYLLMFLFNIKATLLTLIEIAIGARNIEYVNVIFTTEKLLKMIPFLKIEMNSQEDNMLIFCLKTICMTNIKWDIKKFINFINFMLLNKVTSADHLINNVYIPYLFSAPLIHDNLICILQCIRYILNKKLSSKKSNYALLVIILLKIASRIRNSKEQNMDNNEETIESVKRLLMKIPTLNASQKRMINDSIRAVEPIDRISLSPSTDVHRNHAVAIIKDYERRCFVIHRKLRTNEQSKGHKLASIKLDRKALIRHMILRVMRSEYETFLFQITVFDWFYFGWCSDKNAFENIVPITIEAIKLSIVYNVLFSEEKFMYLLFSLFQYCKLIAPFLKDLRYIINVLFLNLAALRDISRFMPRGELFEEILKYIQDNFTNIIHKDITNCFEDLVTCIETYAKNCTPRTNPITDVPSYIQNLLITDSFVSACIKLSNMQAHSCIDEILNSINKFSTE